LTRRHRAGDDRGDGYPGPEDLTDSQVEEARQFLVGLTLAAPDASAAEVRRTVVRLEAEGKDRALLSAAEAAAIILDGVRSGRWRIIVGKDAAFVDERVRSSPESAYDYASVFSDLPADLLRGAKDLPEQIKDKLPDWLRDQLPES
jgi:hypothetical protein